MLKGAAQLSPHLKIAPSVALKARGLRQDEKSSPAHGIYYLQLLQPYADPVTIYGFQKFSKFLWRPKSMESTLRQLYNPPIQMDY